MTFVLTKKQIFILVGLVFFAIIIAGVGVAIYVHGKDFDDTKNHNNLMQIKLNPHVGGAVTNGPECSGIAQKMFQKGGSVVDAGLASAICEGVSMAQSMGLGGGFFATIYIKEKGEVYTLNARETAPSAATKDMFFDKPEASKIGGLAVAVPGDVRGYQALHQKYGLLPWSDLFQPTINLCRSGFLVNSYLDKVYRNIREMLLTTEGFSDFINPVTNEPYQEGDKVKRLKLAETLEIIASEPDALNQGSLTEGFVKDIRESGGIITVKDMNEYKPQWMKPVKVELSNNQTLYTFPPPGSGVIMAHVLGLLSENLDLSQVNTVTNWQRIIESFKFAYGMRTNLGDPDFVPEVDKIVEQLISPAFISEIRAKIRDDYTSQDPKYYGANTSSPEDHGTAHINVLAPNGDAFTFTGTINLIFGAHIVSPSTGIILNNEMDDFAAQPINFFGLPSSPSNFIQPGKRPLSSMCPSIILDGDGHVRMLVGGAGGSKITTSSALSALRYLWFNETLQDAISHARMHHQLFPMKVSYDPDFDADLIDGLKNIGHNMKQENPDGFGAVTALVNKSGSIHMEWDPRRCGSKTWIS